MDDTHTAVVARIRELRARFAEAHREGMESLVGGDLDQFGEAIRREREIVEEQQRLLDAHRANGKRRNQPSGTPSASAATATNNERRAGERRRPKD